MSETDRPLMVLVAEHKPMAAGALRWQCSDELALYSAAPPGTGGGSHCEGSRSRDALPLAHEQIVAAGVEHPGQP